MEHIKIIDPKIKTSAEVIAEQLRQHDEWVAEQKKLDPDFKEPQIRDYISLQVIKTMTPEELVRRQEEWKSISEFAKKHPINIITAKAP